MGKQPRLITTLSFVGGNTFAVSIYPQQSVTKSLTVANASDIAMDVDLTSTITPPVGNGLTVSIPNKITAPPNGSVTFNIVVSASKSASPGTYNVSIAFNR